MKAEQSWRLLVVVLKITAEARLLMFCTIIIQRKIFYGVDGANVVIAIPLY